MSMKESVKTDLIYFTGFMAGGKSTIGSIIANTLGYGYIDLDKEIEKRMGKKVTEIFQTQGEKYFRELEKTVLFEFAKRHRMVISLGGNTITNPDNFKLIKEKGILIYLKSDLENIFKRLRYKTDRPLLMGEDGTWLREEELKKKITELHKTREPYYESADIVVFTDNKRVGNTVDEIVKKIKPLVEL